MSVLLNSIESQSSVEIHQITALNSGRRCRRRHPPPRHRCHCRVQPKKGIIIIVC